MKKIINLLPILLVLLSSAYPTDITGFKENFNAPVDLTFWRPHTGAFDDGTPLFNVTQEENALKVVMKQQSFADGQMYDFAKLDYQLDLQDHPYAAMKIKVEPGATYNNKEVTSIIFMVSPFSVEGDVQTRQHSTANVTLPADGEWHDCYFDWSVPDADQVTYPNDLTYITRILLETVKWPNTYEATFWIDDFRLGDKAVPMQTVTSFSESFDAPVDLAFWTPNVDKFDDSIPLFQVSQEENALKVIMRQKSFPDGQMYDFATTSTILNLTDYRFASIKIKLEPGALYNNKDVNSVPFMLSPFSVNDDETIQRQHSTVNFDIPDDGEWHEFFFDWQKADADTVATPNDFSNITRILLETVKWPNTHQATFWLDDFKVGQAAQPTRVCDHHTPSAVSNFELYQNYPNPFNPSTTIYYAIPSDMQVKITVYNLLGRQVAVLSDEHQSAGIHSAVFNASGLSSGEYFYRLEAGGQSMMKKLLLVR
jgi:hypothetical protein